jgi:hypothetical protein
MKGRYISARFGKRWTVNECLQLHREFELLQLSTNEIALRHKRTPHAIMFKLHQEGLADYNVLVSNYYDLNLHMSTNKLDTEADNEEEYDYEEEADNEEEDNEEEDSVTDNLKYNKLQSHIIRLENQVIALTEILTKQSKNSKSVFSLFS